MVHANLSLKLDDLEGVLAEQVNLHRQLYDPNAKLQLTKPGYLYLGFPKLLKAKSALFIWTSELE